MGPLGSSNFRNFVNFHIFLVCGMIHRGFWQVMAEQNKPTTWYKINVTLIVCHVKNASSP